MDPAVMNFLDALMQGPETERDIERLEAQLLLIETNAAYGADTAELADRCRRRLGERRVELRINHLLECSGDYFATEFRGNQQILLDSSRDPDRILLP